MLERRWHYIRFVMVMVCLAGVLVWGYWIAKAFLESLPCQQHTELWLDPGLECPAKPRKGG